MSSQISALRARADATTSQALPTDSSGCVVCSSTMAQCPSCPPGQECSLLTQTCNSCPKYVCTASGSRLSGSNVGGIVGGVIGGVAAIVIALAVYYFLVYRKKRALTNDMDLSGESYFGSHSAVTHTGFEDDAESMEKSERPRALRQHLLKSVGKQAQISSYDSFMRPPGYNKRGVQRGGAGKARPAQSTYGAGNNNDAGAAAGAAAGGDRLVFSDGNSRRLSMETSVSTTNALNILPIAYIPGVTIRATRNNTGSIYLTEESVFSDMTGIDNALIVHQQGAGPQLRSTMTAIKAQPRLVNVGKIDEDDEEEDDEEDDEEDGNEASRTQDTSTGSAWNQSGSTAWNQSTSTAWNHSDDMAKNDVRVSVDDSDEILDADSDSDVDSDIGEIHRATSTRREREIQADAQSVNSHEEARDDESDGSFTLDIGR